MNKQNYEIQAKKLIEILQRLKYAHVDNLIELGARDCSESVYFSKSLPNAKIYSFECNPDTLPICRKKIS